MGQQYEDEIDLLNYLRVFYKYRLLIAAIVVLGMLWTGISGLRQPKKYEAWTAAFPIEVEYNLESLGSVERPAVSRSNLIVSILESRTMADRVISQLDLKKVWNTKLMVDARRALQAASEVRPGKNDIIKLFVVTEDPKLSADIANAYMDNLDYFNDELKIGPQRKIIQVIDRAVVPEERVSRGLVKKVMTAGMSSFFIAILVAFTMEFLARSEILKRMKE